MEIPSISTKFPTEFHLKRPYVSFHKDIVNWLEVSYGDDDGNDVDICLYEMRH